jgi:hypothetical protein
MPVCQFKNIVAEGYIHEFDREFKVNLEIGGTAPQFL